jgi:cytoplasmic tRNA 2-thiolation protein 1
VLRGDLPRLHRCTCIVTESTSSPISRSKPLKYAYEKEIVLYAHHRKLEYFSTECIYSPEAFRGSARSLIKSLERVRPSAILDIVRSGEAFAEMVPEEIRGSTCGGGSKTTTKATIDVVADKAEEEEGSGCRKGTMGDPSRGGEMSQFEKQLEANEKAAHLETEIVLSPPLQRKKREKKEQVSKTKKQQLGSCRRCGYMSSQELCKACVILDDLNKNRPKIEIELDEEEEEVSSSVRRRMEALDLRKSLDVI